MSRNNVKAVNDYRARAFDRLNFAIHKSKQPNINDIRIYAEKAGETPTAYIYKAVRDRMISEGYTPTKAPQDTETETETETDTNDG